MHALSPAACVALGAREVAPPEQQGARKRISRSQSTAGVHGKQVVLVRNPLACSDDEPRAEAPSHLVDIVRQVQAWVCARLVQRLTPLADAGNDTARCLLNHAEQGRVFADLSVQRHVGKPYSSMSHVDCAEGLPHLAISLAGRRSLVCCHLMVENSKQFTVELDAADAYLTSSCAFMVS